MKWIVSALLTGLMLTGFGSPAAAGAGPSKKTIAKLFTEWDAALATGDPAKVADRYAPDAVLVPTLSSEVRTDRAGIVDYFRHFLEGKPRGTITRSEIRVLGHDTAVDSGTYRFSLLKDGKPAQVDARYTYVYQKRDGRWLIVSHHSSAMPKPVTG